MNESIIAHRPSLPRCLAWDRLTFRPLEFLMSRFSRLQSLFLGQWFSGRAAQRRRGTKALPLGAVSEIASLEARRMLAGTTAVTFAAGTLTLTSVDDFTQAGVVAGKNNNVIVLTGTGAGIVTVSGAGETFSGAGAGLFNGVTKITVTAKDGNDTVTFTNVSITGLATVLGGDGNNTLTGTGGSLGSLTVTNGDGFDTTNYNTATVLGAVTITNGEGSSASTFATVTLGSLKVTNLDGSDLFILNGVNTISGTTQFNNGLGNSSLSFNGSGTTLNGALTIINGDGNDHLAQLGLTSAKAITITNGNGKGRTLITSGTIVGAVSITNGEGEDLFQMSNNSAVSLTGNLTVNNKSGGSTNLLKGTVTGSVSITSLAGNDVVTAPGSLAVTGTTTLNLGNGNSKVDFQSTGTLNFGGALSITSSDGDDEFKIKSPSAYTMKAVTINWGLGDSETVIDGTTIAMDALSITGNFGDHEVKFKGISLTTKNVTLNFKGRNTSAQVQGIAIGMNINGNLSVTIGNGNNTGNGVIFDAPLNVTGTTTATFGTGDESLFLTGGGTLTGNVTVTGNGGGDTLALRGMTLVGNLSANLGTGDDFVGIDNSVLQGTVVLTLGAGADLVDIEQRDLGTLTRFEKAVTINADAGVDLINVGIAADNNDFAQFVASLTVNGGLGIDQAFFKNAGQGGTRFNLFGIIPVFNSIEVQL